MQLTRLEIKGFKSFGDKIIINFNEGVTAIVGPNGCGKSNVVDAIRWVLGEQSTRMLRSEKMDNVIFNGTKSRKPANLAEVSLTFDNTKNILPTDFSQITVTRRLYRSGESEYRLNDVLCRLKDITDLFLDTGIGADSYSIIELKMIDEIITNKEGSRRNLFEEASGISKYKLRKKQTFNKLKDTEADLERVEDLLFEIEKNLKTLENQAKKTERYYRLKEQYKSYSLVLASFRIAAFGSSLTHIEDQEQKQQVEKTGIVALIGQLEAVVQQQKLDSLTSEKNLSAQQKATNEFVVNIRAYESEQKLKNEQLKFQQDRETRITQELDKDGDQLKLLVYNIQRLTDEKELEDKNLQVVKEQLSGLKQEVDESRLKQLNARDDLNQVANAKNVLQNQVYQTEKNLDIFHIQQKALEQEGQRNLEDKTSKEAELSQFTEVITGLKSRLQDVEEDYRGLISFDNKLKEDIASAESDLSSVQEIIIKESRKLDALQNEYNLTKSMVDNLEGFPESIRFLSKSSVWTGNVPLFSDILFCREEYRIAVENYLEPLMNYYIVNTYGDAIKGINLLSSSAQGRAQFFVLENYEAPPNPMALGSSPEGRTLENGSLEALPFGERLDGAVPALQVIQVDPRYQELCSHLLKNVYIVDDKDGREFNNDQLSDKIVLVGKTGKFNKTRYTMAGGSVGLFDGKRIGRAKNLETLSKSITAAEKELAGLKGRFDAIRGKLSSLKSTVKTTELKQNQLQINQLNNELITVNTRKEQYEAFIGSSMNRKEDIATKIDKIKAEQGALRPQLEDLKKKSELQNDIVTTKQMVFNELNEQVTLQSNAYNQENIRFHQQLNKVSGLLKDLDYRQGQREQLDDRLKQNNAELEKVKIAIRENLIHAGSSDTGLLEMYTQKEELEKGTQHAEQDYYEWRGKIAATENEITALRRKKDNADFIENEIKDRRNNLKLELNALKERLSVEFNVDIHDLPENDVVAGESEKEVKEKTEKLKKQLDDFGAINPLAVEAYQEMNERCTFIQAQKKDLADAKASLLATIQEIDGTAKEKFMSSFIAVRENFIRVFRSLFNEEDSCDLLLTDPLFPLESDIDIIAKPKGKRPLSINQLSGGEKTLTATAILFSLYLLKPAPFCIFDEVDAPLDDTNIDKFNHIIREFSKDSQFIIISHNKRTIASTDIIYGVTMVEQGISRVVPVDLRELVN